MPPGFSSDFKESVRSQTDLVTLVSESVSLTPVRSGADYVGLCPFHADHRPSMHVYPERQSYRCWVCDAGGDCFSWVMKIENIDFPEALRMLATRAGLEMPASHGRRPHGGEDKNDLYAAVTWTESIFHQCLLQSPSAEPARDYLRQRDFTAETIAKFKLGYHPDDWDWLLNRARGKFTAKQLLAAKLIGEKKQGAGYFDYFVDRVMFPIHDSRGRPVAFGGRVIPGRVKSDAKYFNSPESPIFPKSRLLYGLDFAREAIRELNMAAVVEGYTDCITAHQHGITHVVGTLGTALTDAHVTMLKRFARKVVLIYDGDDAGQAASERALAKFLSQDIDLRVLTLPAGEDPAEYIGQHGKSAFEQLIREAPEAWEHKLNRCLNRFGTDSVDGRQQVLAEMLDLLAVVPRFVGTSREAMILNRLSQRLGLSEQIVRQQLDNVRRKGNASIRRLSIGHENRMDPGETRQAPAAVKRKQRYDALECEILGIIFAAPETVETIRLQVRPEDFVNARFRQILEVCYELAEQGMAPDFDRVSATLEDPNLKRLAVAIDDQARNRRVAEKLQTCEAAIDGTELAFLDATIENLRWCREERLHERSKGEMAQLVTTKPQLDDATRAMLHKASEYHQKRAAKRS